jgi:predicted nucleic acid-binding protein
LDKQLLVSDSGPLIVFAIAGLLPALGQLRGPLLVPSAVLNECLARPSKPGVSEIRNALINGSLLEIQPSSTHDTLRSDSALGQGEIAVLSICKAKGYIAVIDEVRARKLAKFMQINYVGSGGLLLELKRAKIIAEIKPVLDTWAAHDYFISDAIRGSLLTIAQELEL